MEPVADLDAFIGVAYFVVAGMATIIVDAVRRYVKMRLDQHERHMIEEDGG